MASKDSLEIRKLLAKGVVIQAGSDKSVALRLKYKGTGSVTSVTVVTATSVALITSDGGTDTYEFATYTTMGALADKINSDGIFECKVLDVLRSAGSDNNLLAAALTATNAIDEAGNAVFDLYTDSSAFLQYGACLSAHRGFGLPKGHRVTLSAITYVANVGTAAADSVQIWKRKNGVEKQIFGQLSVDTNETTITFAVAGGVKGITSNDDEEFVVLVKDAASLADGGFIRVTGEIE